MNVIVRLWKKVKVKTNRSDLGFIQDLEISERGDDGVLVVLGDFDELPTLWRITYGWSGVDVGVVYAKTKEGANSIVEKLKEKGFSSVSVGEVPVVPLDPWWCVKRERSKKKKRPKG